MRTSARIAIIAGVVLASMAIGTASLYLYISRNARQIFNAQVSSLTRRPVEARAVSAAFPFGILIEGVTAGDVFACERARVTVDPVSLFHRQIMIRKLELYRPVIVWRRSAPSATMEAVPGGTHSDAGAATGRLPGRSLTLAHVVVHDGVLKIILQDEAGALRPHTLEQIQLRAQNVPLSDTPARTEFFMTALLTKLDMPFVGHFVKASGWLNWAARDMDATAQAMDDDGRIGLDVKLASRQNAMTVFGSIHLTGDQGPQAVGERSGLVESVALGALSSTETDVDADFSFNTRMDDPQIGAVRLSGLITTGLNSHATSSNIVAGLKAVGEELFKQPAE